MSVDATKVRRRGRYATGDAARERILDAATAAFSARGYRGASLAEVSRAVDMTQQGVLYHFPNKTSLLLAVLDERDQRGMQAWPTGKKLVGTRVLDAWDANVEHNTSHYGLVRLAHVLSAEAAGADHPAREYYLDHFDIGRDMLVAGFHSGVEAGELRGDINYEMVARQVIAMSEGLENQWLIDPDGIDIVACFHDYTRNLRQRVQLT